MRKKMISDKFKVGTKLKVIRDIPTIDGVLYKDEIIKIDAIGFPDKDMRVVDNMGRIWYIDFCDVSTIK
tara:strand:+ start:297 stop:503 length:207 start_codon:yes stop_codon:yes gene_type:complete